MTMTSAMNDTKWDELRLAMHSVGASWSTLATNGYKSQPDVDWYYHFRIGGYRSIVYVDIFAADAGHREAIRTVLQQVHVPGEETPEGFRVFGYLRAGQVAEYL